MVECMIKGIPVKFPFEPYEIQKEYMSKVIECLQNDQNGVLESPTGTGKTLSLLCSSLAWLEVKKAQMQAEFQLQSFDIDQNNANNVLLDKLNQLGGKQSKSNRNAFVQWPQIIYSSRTHSQLSQAMNELKRSAYKYMKASVLGSREQMCIHPEIKILENNAAKVQMCGVKVKLKACHYQNRVEREKENPIFTENSVIDIEDLVKFGDVQKFCPYYMAKELKQNADIVFMPYNYLLDPRARKALGVELHNSVVILDEAHNVEKICEDSASLQIKSTDITLCIDEVTGVMKAISEENVSTFSSQDSPPDFSAEDLVLLKGMLLKFEGVLDMVDIQNPTEGVTFDGCYIFELFEKAGVTDNNQAMIIGLIERVCTFMITASEGPFQRKGNGLQLFEDLLRIAFTNIDADFKEKLRKCFKVHVQIEGNENKSGKKHTNWLSKATSSKSECRVLNYWCFSPGFGMNMLVGQGIKSIILTSGTLAPLNPLIAELELNVQVRLENPHIVKGDQVCVKILSKGPDGTPLNSSYRTRNDPAYINSLGMTINNLSKIIPGGLLIFYPSYPIMHNCQENWQKTGQWANICQTKQIYVEPKGKEAFVECMKNYYEALNDPNNGAIFMGVCRGKVSEGLDFVDGNGRAVIITGLPYPPMMDPRIILKKRYLDVCRTQNKEYIGGDAWYGLEATKAVNQAIGRVIRHGKDYGAIILLDSRFNNPRIINQMSLWLRGHVKHANNYGELVRELKGFFRDAQVKFPVSVERKPIDDSLKLDFSKSYFPRTKRSKQDSSTSGNEVVIRKRPGDPEASSFKRTKFTLKANATSEEARIVNELPDAPSIADIKEYLTLLQNKIPRDDYLEFIATMKAYMREAQLEPVLEKYRTIFGHRPQFHYLMLGMKNFLKKDHQEPYQEFLACYNIH